MDNFYELLDLIYKFNKKHPEIRFGQLIQTLLAKDEDLFYLSNSELILRLLTLIEEIIDE